MRFQASTLKLITILSMFNWVSKPTQNGKRRVTRTAPACATINGGDRQQAEASGSWAFGTEAG